MDEKLLEETMNDLLRKMEAMDPGSEDYASAASAFAELSKAKTEDYKVRAEDWNKQSEIQANKVKGIVDSVSKTVGTLGGAGITFWTIKRLTKYEDEVASVTSRVMSFLPKFKFW